MFQNKLTVFCLAMRIILTYVKVLAKVVVPITGEKYFKWKQTDIAIIWVFSMISYEILQWQLLA